MQVQPTTSSSTTVKDSPVKYGIGGALAGLVLGLIVAFVWDAIDNGSRARQQQLAGTLNLPVLGNLPTPPRRLRTDNRLVTMEHGEVGAEAFRLLAVRLGLLGAGAGSHSLVVTSALEEEGKSTTAANLAVALAQIGKSVVLLDGDLIRPTAARFFGAEGQAGLFEVLSGELGIDDVAVTVDVPAGQGNGRPPARGAGRPRDERRHRASGIGVAGRSAECPQALRRLCRRRLAAPPHGQPRHGLGGQGGLGTGRRAGRQGDPRGRHGTCRRSWTRFPRRPWASS